MSDITIEVVVPETLVVTVDDPPTLVVEIGVPGPAGTNPTSIDGGTT